MENRCKVGALYEEQAAEYLIGQGFRILERNFRCRLGEIDLVAEEEGVLVFVEVKYRRSARYGDPAEAVTPSKQRTICRVADYYRMVHHVPESRNCRFDVAAVLENKVEIYRDAFPYQGKW